MNKKKYNHATILIFITLILFALCTFIGCLFLYFHGDDSSFKKATLLFSSSTSSEITVDSSMPITDTLGKQLTFEENQTKYGYSEFSISANMEGMDSIRYEIYAVPVGVALELPKDYVKVYLTEGKKDLPVDGYAGSVVPTYYDLKVATSDPAAKKIYSGVLKKNEVKNFKLRVWLSDIYPITTEYRNFTFHLYVKVID